MERPNFHVAEGVVIAIPEGVVEHFASIEGFDAALAEKEELVTGEIRHPKKAFLQEAPGEDDRFCFATSDIRRGKVLFVPDGLKAGDEIRILWADPKCACAMRVDQEH